MHCTGRESNSRPLDHESNALSLHYRVTQNCGRGISPAYGWGVCLDYVGRSVRTSMQIKPCKAGFLPALGLSISRTRSLKLLVGRLVRSFVRKSPIFSICPNSTSNFSEVTVTVQGQNCRIGNLLLVIMARPWLKISSSNLAIRQKYFGTKKDFLQNSRWRPGGGRFTFSECFLVSASETCWLVA